ncbi:hypothetical protein EVC45_42020 [Paraburkholderia sp. UYCP14C]|uniref:hypothetical protein n=1 Tax=Paraburkholderia sp. UYCP14C TaxID=2511130 RepID=UPI00101F59E3|nr:hypothetical protein [Paraburkholderia sp. UYCP14C]RZF23847.1 hypothetical protein EVC45_42020 [Paraburkholderia sp. UYCP14C]
MSNEIHAATISNITSAIAETNQQLNSALIGNGGDVTKIRRKLANLHVDLSAAEKLADEAREKVRADAEAAVDAGTAKIGADAVASVNAKLAAAGVTHRLAADEICFMNLARNIAIANHESGIVGAELSALTEKAAHVAQVLGTAVQRHADLKARRAAGDASGAPELYGLSLDIEQLTALHAGAVARCDAIDDASAKAAVERARAALTAEENLVIKKHLLAHTRKAEATFMASIKSLVGFVRVQGEPFEKSALPRTIYPFGEDLDWFIRTGALRA